MVGEQKLQKVLELFGEVCEGGMEEDNGDFYYFSNKHSAKLDIRNISTGMKAFAILCQKYIDSKRFDLGKWDNYFG